MLRKFFTRPSIVTILLILQIIPLLLFPPQVFSPTSQEWWLPVLLAVLVLIAIFQLVFRRTVALWPWYLVSFSQGFNIISRLMMFMPHASRTIGDSVQVDWLYIILSIVSVVISMIYIIYCELPDVRMSLYSQHPAQQTA